MKLLHTVLGVTAGLLLATASKATTYSLSGDFSNASNPNGTWSFVQGSTPMAHFFSSTPNAINVALSNGYWGMGSDLNTSTPEVGKVTVNGSVTGSYSDADFLAGDVILHSTNPGSGAGVVAVNWTAPANGVINFSGSSWYAHSPVARSNEVAVLLGNTPLGVAVLSTSSHSGRNAAWTFGANNVAVSSGTVLSVQYMPSAGQTFGSIAGLSETIEFTAAVPEASTWALWSLGLVLLAGLKKRHAARAAS